MNRIYILGLLTVILCAYAKQAHSQGSVRDATGNLITTDTENFTGTPYLTKEWQKGAVTMTNGKTFSQMDLKLDLVNQRFVFRDAMGQTMAFTTDVVSAKIDSGQGAETGSVFRKGYSAGNALMPSEFVQVLAEGTETLLKKTNISIRESREYNSASITKTFTTNVAYYLAHKDKSVTQLPNDKKGVVSALADKSPEVDKYIAAHKLNVKKESDLINVLNYYNSL